MRWLLNRRPEGDVRLRLAEAFLLLTVCGCDPAAGVPAGSTPASESADVPAAAEPVVALCGPDEPGERLSFSGRVLDYDGRPLPGAAVMAYHADRDGLYNRPDAGTRVPRIRGVAVTDAAGRFAFSTIRPAAYPDGSEPAHIHVGVMAPAHRVRDLAYWFEGDPLITDRLRREAARSDAVIVKPERRGDAWSFRHDIRLEGN